LGKFGNVAKLASFVYARGQRKKEKRVKRGGTWKRTGAALF